MVIEGVFWTCKTQLAVTRAITIIGIRLLIVRDSVRYSNYVICQWRRESFLTCLNSWWFFASIFALWSQVPSKNLSSEARSTSTSFMSWINFWIWRFKALASFCWKAVIASEYTWFASFDSTCRVKSTKSYLSKWYGKLENTLYFIFYFFLWSILLSRLRVSCQSLESTWIIYHCSFIIDTN